jgi:hypothetical protein
VASRKLPEPPSKQPGWNNRILAGERDTVMEIVGQRPNLAEWYIKPEKKTSDERGQMTLIINPGSDVSAGEGWANTFAVAKAAAVDWLAKMHGDGMTDVKLLDDTSEDDEREGRWTFSFRHAVTGTVVELETHGIDNSDAYCKQHIMTPRVYWRGSSSAEPVLEDFAAPGFMAVRTFRREGVLSQQQEKG